MRIGISINGEGRGHITRMTALADGLKEHGELFFWASPRDRAGLESRFQAPVYNLPPLTVAMNRNRLDLWQTGKDNLDVLANTGVYLKEQCRRLEEIRPDVFISDFEPFLARAAGKCGIPVLQLNHPGIVLRSPSLKPDAVLAKLVAYNMMGKYDREMISSFYNGDIGPLLRREIREAEPRRGDFLVVYLRDGVDRTVCNALNRTGKIRYRTFPGKEWDFSESLASCRGVITHAGHQLLSEALSLKKPVLAFPIEGQYEQRLNARMLETAGWGQAGRLETLEQDLASWLDSLDEFPRKTAGRDVFRFSDDLDSTLEKVLAFAGGEALRVAS